MSARQTLLFKLEGPMSSWGYRSRFDYRDSAPEPTRSAVIGLICAAMGIPRDAEISRFDKLRFGVRADKEGRPERDYHTASDVIKASGAKGETVQSWRDYLADASFTVGLESSDEAGLKLLGEIASALKNPEWFLFLGRKSFALSEPLLDKGAEPLPGTLESHLDGAPASDGVRKRVVIDRADGAQTQEDWPESFSARRFRLRRIKTFYTRATPVGAGEDG